MKKKKPSGFIAICQCRKIVGAMDIDRTVTDDAGKILGRWLMNGCTVEPKFSGNWCVKVETCSCGT